MTWLLVLVLGLLGVAGCEHRQIPTVAYSPGELEWGSNTTHFAGPAPLAGDSIPVHYHIPETGNPATFPILIAMHGADRNAQAMRDAWVEEADGRGFIVVAPQIPAESFPGDEYALGRLLDPDGRVNPPGEWSYGLIEALFDEMVERLGSSVPDYALYGYGEGARFAQRFFTFMSDPRARVVLVAAANDYVVLDPAVEYPYGLAWSQADDGRLLGDAEIAQRLGGALTVLVGQDDDDPDHPQLSRTDGAMAQGAHRVERAGNYVLEASRRALELELPFGWTVITVPGVGHSNAGLVPQAATLVLP